MVYLTILVFAVMVVVRIIFIQTVERDELIAQANDYTIDTVRGIRGNIYSMNGSLIATTIPIYDIGFDYSNVKADTLNKYMDVLCDSLSGLFRGKSKSHFKNLLKQGSKTGNKCVYIAKKIRMDEYERLKTFPVFNEYNCLNVGKTMVRECPYGMLARRTVGLTKDIKGKTVEQTYQKGVKGLEQQYDDYLMGKVGYQLMMHISGGYVPISSSMNVQPENGYDIYASLDMELQDIAEESLMRCMVDNGASKGCAIVMDVKSGMIEAMANLTYDSVNKRYDEDFNVATGHNLEPGSTFKAVTMTALLENDPNFDIYKHINIGTTRKYKIGKHTFTDTHVIGEGNPTIKEAFWESSNIAFCKLVEKIFEKDPMKFANLIEKTKINEPLKLEWKGEEYDPNILGVIRENKTIITAASMSIGYSVELSPLSLATYYNAIANNGCMVKPQFLREIRNGNELVYRYDTIVINERIASERTIKKLQELLLSVVQNGTGKQLNDCGFPIAGKTGTSRIAFNKKYQENKYNSLFAGYFPADNPKYTCVVVIVNPTKGSYYGAKVALPVFKDIAERVYATRLGVQDVPENNYVTKANDSHNKLHSVDMDSDIVPDLKGMNVTDAVYVIESMGWNASFNGYGVVKKQSVKAGTKLLKGKDIILKLG